MDPKQESKLVGIAGQVSDGNDLDWDELAATHPELAAGIRNLRLLESFSRTCRRGVERGTESSLAPEVWGPLRILEKIGEGSFGEVFRAHDPVLRRDVALKLRRIRSEGELSSHRKHLAEARRLARVRHPNVLTIHGIEVHEGRTGMWTDFIEGSTLESALANSGPCSSEELAGIGLDLAHALQAVHGAGLVHGDIKTANVMRERDGRVVLMDFGAGRPADGAETDPLGSGGAEGTPIAMAPEVLRGGPASVRSDLYALGVLLYRMATGRNPFEAEDLADLITKVEASARVPLGEARPGLPEALVASIECLLAEDPDARPTSALEFGLEIEAGLTGAGLLGTTAGVLPGGGATTRFIGRRAEILGIARACARSRLVVLVGPGGVGKTRLAQEAARRLAPSLGGDLRWIDLTGLAPGTPIEQELVLALELRIPPRGDVREVLTSALGKEAGLLVLDNAEHVMDSARELLPTLIDRCPGLSFLVTSREPLNLPLELRIQVAAFEPPGEVSRANFATEYDAVRLFLDRAHAQRPDFRLTDANAGAVSSICRRVAGIPLAIELAAAQLRSFGPEEIERRLAHDLRLITETPVAGSTSFHPTLRASIEWSAGLLAAEERELLAGLSVFRGGWTLEAAETICGPETGEPSVAAIQASLVAKSLVVFDPAPSGKPHLGDRYRLLEMVRVFAAEELAASDHETRVRTAFARLFRDLAERANEGLFGPDQTMWRDRLLAENDNLEHALDQRLPGREAAETALRTASSLGQHWMRLGWIAHGIRRSEDILARPAGAHPTPYRAALWTWLGNLREAAGSFEDAIQAHLENAAISELLGERRSVAVAWSNCSNCYYYLGDMEPARELAARSLEVMEEVGCDRGTALSLNALARAEERVERYEEAAGLYARGLEIQRRRRDPFGVALLAHNLSGVLSELGRIAEARSLATEALELRQSLGNSLGVASSLSYLGGFDLAEGDPESARARFVRSLTIRREQDFAIGVLTSVERLADVELHVGRHERAALLFGAAARQREELGAARVDEEVDRLERTLEKIAEALGADAARRAFDRGGMLPWDEMVELAIDG